LEDITQDKGDKKTGK